MMPVWELERFQTPQVTFKVAKVSVLVPSDRPHYFLLVFYCNQSMTLHCITSKILSVIPKNQRLHDPEHILHRSNLSCMHCNTSRSICTPNLKCLALPIPRMTGAPTFNKCSAVAEMGDRLATIDMGQKLGAVPWGAGSLSNTMSPGPRPTSVPSGILINPTVWHNTPKLQRDREDNGSVAQGEPCLVTVAQKVDKK